MKQCENGSKPKLSLLSKACIAASLSVASVFTIAAPGTLSDKPLTLVTSTKPNILLLLDDSGSMNFEAVVTDEAQSIHGVDVDNDLAPMTRVSAQNDQELRALCAGYNALAYNPRTDYSKWKDYLGSVFPDYQSVDLTAVVDNPFNGTDSVRTSDLTDHIYIHWDDADGDNKYDYDTDVGECGPSITEYDSAAGEAIALLDSGTLYEPKKQGIFTDSNLNGGDRYQKFDSGKLVINVPDGDDDSISDFITFTVVEFNVDVSSGDTDSLTVYGGDDVSPPIANAITVTSQFNGSGNPKPVVGSTYTLPNDSVQPTVSSELILNDDSSGNRNNEIREFTVAGNTATLVFDGGSNDFTRSGFVISWRHSRSTAGPLGDGLLTKEDCDQYNCVVVEKLPLTEADVPEGAEYPHNTQENYANWYSYYRDRISVAKKTLSDVVYDSDYRVGFATLNDNGYGGAPIKDMENDPNGDISADKSELLRKIYAARSVRTKSTSSEGTPLLKGLSNAGRYFTEGIDPDADFFGSTGISPHTPIATTHQEDDDNIASNDPTVSKSPIFNNAYGGECQQNFTLAFTDGAWSDTVADYLNTDHDINGGASGFVGDQDSVGPYAGGAYADVQVNGKGFEDSLADISMYYFANDLASSVRDSLSLELHGDTISHQHMVTFAIGFGVSGNATDDPTDYVTAHSRWPNPVSSTSDKIDDLRHAAFNGRGEYVSGSNAETLSAELDKIITEIRIRANNTATGSSFSSFQLTDGEFRFSSSYETANWSGDLEGFLYDGATNTFSDEASWSAQAQMFARENREDTRQIITSNGEQGIPFRFSFVDDDATAYDYRSAGNAGFLNEKQVSDLLANAPHTTATAIPTTTDVGEIARNQAYGEVLVNYLRGDGSYDGLSLEGASVLNGNRVSNGTAGSVSFESATDSSNLHVFRNRSGRYLGSMVHSQPEFVGAPNNTYPDDIETTKYSTFTSQEVHKNREPMIYIGSNGGMLHGFYATGEDAGKEVFAYVPSILSDTSLGGRGLHDLALETYDGNAYVDGSPNVSDVFVNRDYPGDSDFSDPQWRSYLVAGLRSGGRGIYVLDVTNPDNDSGATPAPKLSDAENVADRIVVSEFVHEKLGYVYSRPIIGKMNNGRWAAILGNGYNSTDSGASTASLFIVYLDKPTETVGDNDTDGNGVYNDGYGDYTIITASTSSWLFCANDGDTCTLPENAQVRYGSDGVYTTPISLTEGEFTCDVATMGDPSTGAANPKCEYSDNNGLSQPEATDLDGNGTLDRVYAGDLHGNMWIFDISNASDGEDSAGDWGLHSEDNTPFFTACASNLTDGVCSYDDRQPITTRPVVRNNPIQSRSSTEPNKLVFFGTGQYLAIEDKGSVGEQSFYTVWDAGSATNSLSKSNLTEQVINNYDNGLYRRISSRPVDYNASEEKYGWYYKTLPGTGDTSLSDEALGEDDSSAERVVVNPIVFSNLLIFATFIPNEGLCNASAGTSYLMVVSPLTGGEPPFDVFGIDGASDAAGVRIDGAITGIGISSTGNGPSVTVDTANGEEPETLELSEDSDNSEAPSDGNRLPEPGRKTWTIFQ